MALTAPPQRIPTGSATPRLAPPLPLKTLRDKFAAVAAEVGIKLWPWQRLAASYLMARRGKGWMYREVCIVVARQNGKTELLIPRIIMDLRDGKRILHTAHRMRLPRKVFLRVAQVLHDEAKTIRYAQGQEEIIMPNGGSYVIIAALRGARGESADTLIIDEVREFEDFDALAATTPTLSASADPQTIYLSNAGSEASVVLNQLREHGSDERSCYLEWSADPELDPGDLDGWAQANPALGYLPSMYDNLQHAFANRPLALFETEHLCRWVVSLAPSFVTDIAFRACKVDTLGKPFRPYLGVALDPNGKRASAALAWKVNNGVAYRPILEVTDVDPDAFGEQVRAEALHHRVKGSAYSGLSDAAIARYLTKPTAVDGRLFSNASANFAALVETRKLHWSEADALTEDLRYTVRKDHAEGSWSAVRSDDSRPITAVLAAVRAVWLAAAPKPAPPRIG